MLAPNTLKVEEKGRMDNGTFECRHNTNSWWKPCFLLKVQIIETHHLKAIINAHFLTSITCSRRSHALTNTRFMAIWAWMVA